MNTIKSITKIKEGKEMNREIKFRGIPLFGKNFVHGSLVVDINEKGEETFTIRRNQNGKVSNFEVISETVGQYTGLADVNGVEIYENDLLSLDDSSEVYEVVYLGNKFVLCQYDNIVFEHEAYFRERKIIGNKYECNSKI